MRVQELAERLGDWRKVGPNYLVHCPAHDDRHASLELADGDKGVVMICRAGCDQDRVIDLICTQARIKPADLFYEPQHMWEQSRLVEIYDYVDLDGILRHQTLRYDPKGFSQRRPDPAHPAQYIANLHNIDTILYRSHELREGIQRGDVACICEGEKAVEAIRAIGLTATCSPMGAGKWKAHYSELLRGAHCIILPDNDEAGQKHAMQVALSLQSVAASIKVLELPGLPHKGDVYDWVQAGGTREQLEALAAKTPCWQPPTGGQGGLTLTRLGDLLAEPEEQAEWLVDQLLPAGGIALLVAKPKVGKTTLARNLALTVEQSQDFLGRKTRRGPVMYLALEEKRSEVRNHFLLMGATGTEDIHIYTASAPADGLQHVRIAAEQIKPVLIILDPLFLFTRVKDVNDYVQVSRALEPLRNLARETGAHVLCVHHAGKTERGGGDSILGSTAILAAVDTALILKCTDRYRTIHSIQRYGEALEETVLDFDQTTRTVTLGTSKEQADESRMGDAICNYLASQEEPVTEAVIDDAVEGRRAVRKKALRQLVTEGKVIRYGKGGKGEPFTYALPEMWQEDADSARSQVPSPGAGTREPESENGVIPHKDEGNTGSQRIEGLQNPGNQYRGEELLCENHHGVIPLSSQDTMPRYEGGSEEDARHEKEHTGSLVPNTSLGTWEPESTNDILPRQVKGNTGSPDVRHMQDIGNQHATCGNQDQPEEMHGVHHAHAFPDIPGVDLDHWEEF
jgi:hypothetical protein